MMRSPDRMIRRRGLTFIETLLAISITAMVGAGIATMMSALGSDAAMQYDIRSILVRSGAAQARLSAYIAPARCVLDVDDDMLVLWIEDSRQSDTVHASEIRWISHESTTGQVQVDFVTFPSSWSESTIAMADREYASSTDWKQVLDTYRQRGLLASAPLVDDVESAIFTTPGDESMNARIVQTSMQMTTTADAVPVTLSDSVRIHRPPVQ